MLGPFCGVCIHQGTTTENDSFQKDDSHNTKINLSGRCNFLIALKLINIFMRFPNIRICKRQMFTIDVNFVLYKEQ